MIRRDDNIHSGLEKLAGRKDAPNYRPASMKEVTAGKRCGTCKARDPKTGMCAAYSFVCDANHICDSWTKKIPQSK